VVRTDVSEERISPGSVPVKDILCGVEKAIMALPEETVGEIRQETVRILKGSNKPKDNLTCAERRALRALKSNRTLTVLPADKRNAAVVLGTSDCNQKIVALLDDKTYKKLKKDPTDSVERKTVLLLKKSPSAEETCNGGDTFLRNVGSNHNYTAPDPRRRLSSAINLIARLESIRLPTVRVPITVAVRSNA
jgi:hypothetical protein